MSSNSSVIRFPVCGGYRPRATPVGVSLRELFDAPTIEQMLEAIHTKVEEGTMGSAQAYAACFCRSVPWRK